MSFDGLFLHHMKNELQILQNGKIQKIYQPTPEDFIFHIRSQYYTFKLLINLNAISYRIHFTEKTYQAPASPQNFVIILRKYLEGGVIIDIRQINFDRILHFVIKKRDEMGDIIEYNLYLELFGKDSNLICCMDDNAIIDAYKKQFGINEKRQIYPKVKYGFLDNNKLNPLLLSNQEIMELFYKEQYRDSKHLLNSISGLSPLVCAHLLSSKNPSLELIKLLNDKPEPLLLFDEYNQKEICYITHLNNHKIIKKITTMSLLCDQFYYERSLKVAISQKSHNLALHITKLIEKNEKKKILLEQDLDEAIQSEKYRFMGELILANIHLYPNKNYNRINVNDFSNDKNLEISLDNRLSLKENAQKYFQKYQKGKKAILHIKEQIKITDEEIAYLSIISQQIDVATLEDIEDIINELTEYKYLKNNTKGKSKKQKRNLKTIKLPSSNILIIGKNNYQNEELLWSVSSSGDLWFHLKDAPGSHVILKTNASLYEEDIRIAAMFAAYYSKYRYSSSIPIDYTKVKNIKKIPGKRSCFVSYSQGKTIFIDIDENLITLLENS